MTKISVSQFKEMLKENPVVIDVRTPEETTISKIKKDALEIDCYNPLAPQKFLSLDKDKTYVLYCRTGVRSSSVANFMKQNGFKNIFDIDGGITAWQESN